MNSQDLIAPFGQFGTTWKLIVLWKPYWPSFVLEKKWPSNKASHS